MIHNASIEKYRTPVGAVTCGSEMTIRLYETGESVSKAEIIMYSETFHREYEMKRKKDCMEEHLGTWQMLFLWSEAWTDTGRRDDL